MLMIEDCSTWVQNETRSLTISILDIRSIPKASKRENSAQNILAGGVKVQVIGHKSKVTGHNKK